MVVLCPLMALNVGDIRCSIKDNLRIISCNCQLKSAPYFLLYSLSTLADSLVDTMKLVLVYEPQNSFDTCLIVDMSAC